MVAMTADGLNESYSFVAVTKVELAAHTHCITLFSLSVLAFFFKVVPEPISKSMTL